MQFFICYRKPCYTYLKNIHKFYFYKTLYMKYDVCLYTEYNENSLIYIINAHPLISDTIY